MGGICYYEIMKALMHYSFNIFLNLQANTDRNIQRDLRQNPVSVQHWSHFGPTRMVYHHRCYRSSYLPALRYATYILPYYKAKPIQILLGFDTGHVNSICNSFNVSCFSSFYFYSFFCYIIWIRTAYFQSRCFTGHISTHGWETESWSENNEIHPAYRMFNKYGRYCFISKFCNYFHSANELVTFGLRRSSDGLVSLWWS